MPWQTDQSEMNDKPIKPTEELNPQLIFLETPASSKRSPADDIFSILDGTINLKLNWQQELRLYDPTPMDSESQVQGEISAKADLHQNMFQSQEQDDQNEEEKNNDFEEEKSGIKTPETVPVLRIEEKLLQLQKLSPIQKSRFQQIKLKCNCKKTQCLKMYCECFRSGEVCGDECDCYGCQNVDFSSKKRSKAIMKIINKDCTAFLEKVKYNGCRCTKSQCRKKYCECYAQGLICGKYCRCCDCKNSGKRKRNRNHRKVEKLTT